MFIMLVSLALSACSGDAGGGTPVRFDLRDNEILIPVRVSQNGPFRFLLDTGAGRSIVSAQVARKAGLQMTALTRMLTPAGHDVRPTTDVELSVGDGPSQSVRATVVGDHELSQMGSSIDGIIGQDVLSRTVYTIDYRRRVVTWGAPPCLPLDALVPLDVSSGAAVINVASDGQTMRLIADSGADALVLYTRGQSMPAMTPLDIGLLRTLTGQRLVRRVRLDRLRVGAIELRELTAVMLDRAPDDERLANGLLPLHLFSRVTFNAAAGYMAVER